MFDHVIDDREMIKMSVLEGKLSGDILTWEEIEELQELVLAVIAEKTSTSLPHIRSEMQ
jgi:hypothetical protein